MTNAHNAKAREIVRGRFFLTGQISLDVQKELQDAIATALRDCERETIKRIAAHFEEHSALGPSSIAARIRALAQEEPKT
jgi:predicted butyrate kinase (DUF1464 family)